MKVAFVNRMMGFTRGGGEIWDLRMAERLRDLGVDVTFVIAVPLRSAVPRPLPEWPTVHVPVPHLQEKALSLPRGIGGLLSDVDSQLFAKRAVQKLSGRDDFDLVHVNSRPEFGKYVSDLEQPVTVKMNGPPHSLWYDTLRPDLSSYDLLERFEAIVTTGVTTRVVRENVAHERVCQINPGVDTTSFTPPEEARSGGDAWRLLFVGRFVPAKGLTKLVDAFAALRERHDVTLTLVGDGPLRSDVESYVEQRGVAEAVTFAGYVENDDLPAYYRRADAFVLSSRTDNHPITLLEAMSCGLPVVAPRVGWIPHVVRHERTGLLYDRTSHSEPADTIDELLSDTALREHLRSRARQTAVNEFDWERRATSLKTLFETVLYSDTENG